MLRTRITELFGVQYPIMSAPMAMHSGGRLAGAVSAAGGLGAFGAINPAGPDWIREQMRIIRSQTDKPFAVGFITAFIPMFQRNFEAALDERAPVIALSFGNPQPWLEQAKRSGATVICQVQTIEDAQRAAAEGADIVVAQGNEAGGHTGTMNLLPLLSRVVELLPGIPVMAAGGIANGRSLAAALAAGADGAWLGTAFLATPEAVEVRDFHKQRIIDSDGQDTVFTEAYDIMDGMPWPEGVAGRVYGNRFAQDWLGREEELRRRREELLPAYGEGQQRNDPEAVAIYMGQSAAFVDSVRPAADVLRSICDDAERILRERSAKLLS